jgi:hypothetical protein
LDDYSFGAWSAPAALRFRADGGHRDNHALSDATLTSQRNSADHRCLDRNVIVFVHAIRDNNGNVTSGSVDFHVATRFSGAVTVTGLHIHNAAAGVAGPIVIPTDVNGSEVDRN